MKNLMKKDLSAVGLLETIRQTFDKITDKAKNPSISLSDCLMSGLAIFSLKYPSLLQFDHDRNKEITINNLKTLYGIEKAPCDTYLRERLDEIDPDLLKKSYNKVLAKIQRGKILENYTYYDGHYLVALDGTGFFSSSEIHCDNCCEKHHRNGRTTYYHKMLGAVLVHPNQKVVFPFCPEPILKQDGTTKNDCEMNASKRLLPRLRREHPHLKMIIIEDALSSTEPHLNLLKELNMSYIIGVKPTSHKYLFECSKTTKGLSFEETDSQGTRHRYYCVNKISLNESKQDCEVNFLNYQEIKKTGEEHHFSWITNIPITKNNAYKIMRGGRARWKIENETFNTLKNQGYNFEHNFGHGNNHLSTVFGYLMMLAFLIDQAQQQSCIYFKRALEKCKSKRYLWISMQSFFKSYFIESWKTLYDSITYGHKGAKLTVNTS